ncbi:MAG: response regulator receiver [bacterium]|nr:MAG: response regulator receiver [bacterium]KAF0148977.1 MAG: response regulator receiver [bacterium]KAF0168368.1 MAG: response regulator receiver [bacterium]TXT21032.1 MAG: response regulator receiver [bacterium]
MAADSSQARRILENLRRGFIDQLPMRLAAIEQAWIDCYMASDPAPALYELTRLAHSLRGSATTYGLLALGDVAAQLENDLRPWLASETVPDPLARAELDALVARMREVVHALPELPPESGSEENATTATRALVYILEDDVAQSRWLRAQLGHFGYQAEVFDKPAELLAQVARQRPDACVLDIIIGADEQAGIALGHDLHRDSPKLPLIYASVRDDIDARLGAVRAGGQAYVTKPINLLGLLEELDRVSGHLMEAPYRILVVEDDASLARYYGALLRDAGMETRTLSEPLRILDALAEFSPDLLLMDVYMPDCTGAELARVIRQHAVYGALPIVFLSAEDDKDMQYAALRHGGDDFLTKPVNARALIRAVGIRAQRTRLLNRMMVCDAMTGLLNHGRIKEILIGEVGRARRANTSLSIAMLDLDHFKSINDRFGHAAGDRVIKSLVRLLRQRLRGSDLVGRYGGEEFLVILPDCQRDAAWHLIDGIRARFARIAHCGDGPNQVFSASLSAGLAEFPLVDTAENLLLAADNALYEAKRQGRDRTC